jgi:hypothetical protein
VLTNADIRSYLGVKVNPSVSASEVSDAVPLDSCKRAGVAVFRVPGIRVDPQRLTSAKAPELIDASYSCASASDAFRSFNTPLMKGVGRTVHGIGDEANLYDLTGLVAERLYAVRWREKNHIGVLFVASAQNDTRIGPGLAELLARRAAARS